MNCCFYVAIDKLPLGTVAAIEFLPVIVLAALGARTPRNAAALALAVPGVYLLTDVQLAGEPLGVALAFANAVLFALYIVLAHRVARHERLGGIDGLAASMLIAAVVVTPMAGWAVVPAALDPVALAAGIGVGISSSVIPYVTDQLAMAKLARATYALMVSILPATATVIGIVVLSQVPTWVEIVGVALVVAGVGLHRESRRSGSLVAAVYGLGTMPVRRLNQRVFSRRNCLSESTCSSTVPRSIGSRPPPPFDAVSASTTAAMAISTASTARIVPSRLARRALR